MSDNEREREQMRQQYLAIRREELDRVHNKYGGTMASPTADLDAGFAYGFCAGLWAGGGIVLIISLLIMGSP